MTRTSPTVVLIVADDAANAARWRQILETANFEVRIEAAEAMLPDVVLSDRPLEPREWQFGRPLDDASHVGTVIVGDKKPDSDAPDARLETDFAPHELVSTCRLVAEIARLRRRVHAGEQARGVLSQKALTDPLTRLPNRRAWDEQLAAWTSAQIGEKLCLCLVIFDLDHFKQVNDRLGHMAGDSVLQQTGEALRSALRRDDFLARLGGDEFAALLTSENTDHFADIVERVRLALVQELRAHESRSVTASAGYAIYEGPAPLDPDMVMRVADDALLRAKESGRDRITGERVESS